MTKNIYKLGISMAFLPIFAFPGSSLENFAATTSMEDSEAAVTIEDIRKERAAKIEKYYSDRSMPLAVNAMDFVLTAEKYGLDWKLLPAIAVRESSGGKNACYNNPFGWGSCKIKFDSYKEAIDAVGRNLGGANPKTASYYAGKTNEQKLYYYNGTVVPTYPKEVMKIMDRLDKIEVVNDTELAVK
jgi:hypothetical protein